MGLRRVLMKASVVGKDEEVKGVVEQEGCRRGTDAICDSQGGRPRTQVDDDEETTGGRRMGNFSESKQAWEEDAKAWRGTGQPRWGWVRGGFRPGRVGGGEEGREDEA